MVLIWRTSAPNYKKKSTALKLYCDCDCSRMAVEWVLAEEIFSVKNFFFALTLHLVWTFSTIFTRHDTKIWHSKSIYCSFSSVSRKCG